MPHAVCTRRRARRVVLPLALLAASIAVAPAQEPWTWPESATNLKQLPADFPPARLKAVMTGFTRALGVRCSYCHVGQEGQPLSSYDFASDDNPKKQVAREMLAMLGEIGDRLKKIDTGHPDRVNMWCHTCHDGRPRPNSLKEELTLLFAAEGLEATMARYRELRDRHYGDSTYDFTAPTLNGLGYDLLRRGEHAAAIAIFRLNAEYYPDSSNVWDSLAEAYAAGDQPELAAVFYRKSLELDPTNVNAVEQLRKLSGATP